MVFLVRFPFFVQISFASSFPPFFPLSLSGQVDSGHAFFEGRAAFYASCFVMPPSLFWRPYYVGLRSSFPTTPFSFVEVLPTWALFPILARCFLSPHCVLRHDADAFSFHRVSLLRVFPPPRPGSSLPFLIGFSPPKFSKCRSS